jgi:hypothetical protein
MTTSPEVHVPWRRLVDRRDRRLSPRLSAVADAHLATGCAACAADVRTIEELVAAISAGPLDAPPRRAESAAVGLYRDTYLAFGAEVERVVGVLILDDLVAGATLRDAAAEMRRLLWRVGEYEVDASLVSHAGRTDVLAQVVPGGDDPDARVSGFVALRGERGVRVRAPIAPDGRFTFRALASGVYTIEGRVDSLRFVLPPLHVE